MTAKKGKGISEAASKVIRAKQFILEDEHGTPRAVLDVDKDGPGLGLKDETGKTI
jgi:hypothetical protein